MYEFLITIVFFIDNCQIKVSELSKMFNLNESDPFTSESNFSLLNETDWNLLFETKNDSVSLYFTLSVSFILGLINLLTVIGNLFVIATIWCDRNLHMVQNYLVVSLAVADLMVACLVMPLSAVNEANGGQWTLGPLLCDIWISVDVLCCTASILHLFAIAVDRYWTVTHVNYVHSRRALKIFLFIIIIWTISLIISIAPILGWKDPEFEFRLQVQKICLISQDTGYQIVATFASFFGPIIVVLILYWKIFKVSLIIFFII